MRPTLAEARYILSHVYCVHCLPKSDGWVYPWSVGAGEALCARCPCREPADLRLYVASEREAQEWLWQYESALRAPRRFHPLLDGANSTACPRARAA